jgi:hypothetical protein
LQPKIKERAEDFIMTELRILSRLARTGVVPILSHQADLEAGT